MTNGKLNVNSQFCSIEIDNQIYDCIVTSAGAESIIYWLIGTNKIFKRMNYAVKPEMIELAEKLESLKHVLEPNHILIPETIIYDGNEVSGWLFEKIDEKSNLTQKSIPLDFEALIYYYISLVQVQRLLDNGIAISDVNRNNWLINEEGIQYLIDTVTEYATLLNKAANTYDSYSKQAIEQTNKKFMYPVTGYIYNCLVMANEIKPPENPISSKEKIAIVFNYFGLKIPTDINTLMERILDIISQLSIGIKWKSQQILKANEFKL